MAFIKGVIFPNRQAFNGKQDAVFNYYVNRIPNVDLTVVNKWSEGIDALDGSNEVLMIVDDRINGFPWSPEQIVDISTTDPKWLSNDTL